jgi:hypothetical protein
MSFEYITVSSFSVLLAPATVVSGSASALDS